MMKNNAPFCFILVVVLSVLASVAMAVSNEQNGGRRGGGLFSAIYIFGDSITDTGNALIARPSNFVGKLPYGETYFHRPTGRFSDGRVLPDFFAKEWGLSLVDPYLNNSTEHKSGVNFAVGGAAALPESYFTERNLSIFIEFSLDVQVDWFLAYKSKFCAKTPRCSHHFAQALFILGEIGMNDFYLQLVLPERPLPLKEVERSISDIVAAIENTLTKLIEQGSAHIILVPNIFPFGCWPVYLQKYRQEPRDSMGCIHRFNRLAQTANEYLHKMIQKLKAKHRRGVFITEIDYYGATMQVLRNPQKFGINETLVPCCDNFSDTCTQSSVCKDPSRYFSWDGGHITDAGNNAIVSLLLHTKPAPFSFLKLPSAML